MSVEARPRALDWCCPPCRRRCQLRARSGSPEPAFLSGQGPRDDKGNALTGKVGADVTVEEAYRRARSIGLQLLATTRQALGSLDRVEAVLKVLGMVNAVPEFKDHPKVINGCSDLFVEVLGEAGRHARSVGMARCRTRYRWKSRRFSLSNLDLA
jgi:enamine deaminase RidA (YjgF/YER057c/UK114 family)